MSIRNPEKLKQILSVPENLGKALSRHTYGMLSWVNLFGAKLASVDCIETKIIVSRIVADNAKHSKLFSDRAKELGQNPQLYKPPEIGQEIYDILDTYTDPYSFLSYALGSLVHFRKLLEIYISVADPRSQKILLEVKKDVEDHLLMLRGYFRSQTDSNSKKNHAEAIKTLAEDKYTEREEQEIIWYSLHNVSKN
ncbi:MAG: hypothetical protein OXF23_07205 [Candidatus Dadabacteria bacterium]|nr:hypothetical protein [Candidatus Dadabacteria bacterium]MCY4262527.1 hypothetical protein [Candidatus Dadabacteria bacterium]